MALWIVWGQWGDRAFGMDRDRTGAIGRECCPKTSTWGGGGGARGWKGAEC
ncbi:hypothetical protein H6G51_16415 [Limnothrix sp. FACHB-708]|uniref:hypothetical protein n=1 Tax=Limnothrix sp. FACHB-708 TaxID=2692818 RepID=UPI0016861F1D|nr:hypothetical protein [Limnothrix sp. FACHB-708]MBD2554869.1 hypothetical protein [Limnothrix sp. FACHB-708]MBD2592076.1 hypothetical protein [Limnothrix sp. FACHB-406]